MHKILKYTLALVLVLIVGIVITMYLSIRAKRSSRDNLAKIFDDTAQSISQDSVYYNKINSALKSQNTDSGKGAVIDEGIPGSPICSGALQLLDGDVVIIAYITFHMYEQNGIDRVAVIKGGKIIGTYHYHLCCGLATFEMMGMPKNAERLVEFFGKRKG